MSLDLFVGYPAYFLAEFKEFHLANPHIYREFKRNAFKMLKTGREEYSARIIFEVVRWHLDLKTTGDVFKVNNNYLPLYTRLLIHNHPEFTDFFELRAVTWKGIMSDEERYRRDMGPLH